MAFIGEIELYSSPLCLYRYMSCNIFFALDCSLCCAIYTNRKSLAIDIEAVYQEYNLRHTSLYNVDWFV